MAYSYDRELFWISIGLGGKFSAPNTGVFEEKIVKGQKEGWFES